MYRRERGKEGGIEEGNGEGGKEGGIEERKGEGGKDGGREGVVVVGLTYLCLRGKKCQVINDIRNSFRFITVS